MCPACVTALALTSVSGTTASAFFLVVLRWLLIRFRIPQKNHDILKESKQ